MAKQSVGLTMEQLHQGYEQGGLLYFSFNGMQMVAIVRERTYLDNCLDRGRSLEAYLEEGVTPNMYDATKGIEELVRKYGTTVERGDPVR